jgi:hypothetical protein
VGENSGRGEGERERERERDNHLNKKSRLVVRKEEAHQGHHDTLPQNHSH